MPNALVPELAVSDWRRSRDFYCRVLGFQALYERPEEGFSYLTLGSAELIDQHPALRVHPGGGAAPS